MKTYTYEGITYKSESQLRKAVWLKHRKALPKLNTDAEWMAHGVAVSDVSPQKTEPTEAQLALRIRNRRDKLLTDTDYYVMPDYPATEEGLAEVKAYRQTLRDITKQEGFPLSVTWPEKPASLR